MKVQHIFDAIQARFHSFQSRHYPLTKYGRNIKKLKDIHKGESCFIIGNGPSLTAEDLTELKKKNIPCFASNNILKMFEKTDWRPSFYVCEDLLVLKDLKERISEVELSKKLIPINYKWYDDINIKGATYFYQSFQKENNHYPFDPELDRGVLCTGTVTITCMQLASYMGFKDIYLLGIDHSYRQTQDSAGNIITDNSVKDYFDQDYAVTMKKKNIPNLEQTTNSYRKAKEYFERKGVQVYNATRGGKLEVYPRVNFEEIMEKL